MSYETFRTDVLTGLADLVPQHLLDDVMNVIDIASQQYDFQRKEVALTVYRDVPDTVKMYIASKAIQNLSKGTLQNYYNMLCNFFRAVHKPFDAITTNDIRTYLFAYKQTRKICDRTLEQIRIYLNSFFTWCVDEGMLVKNPVSRISAIKFQQNQRHVLSPLELEKMRFSCSSLREKAMLDTLYSSGLRVSELCALKICDVDLDNRTVHVLHGKGDKERTSYINAEAVISISAYLSSRTDDSPYMFVNLYGEKHSIQKRTVEEEIFRIAQRAGLDADIITPHCLRHTFATTLIRNGCPVEHVQRMLGHAKLSTTMIYARIDDDDVRRNHERCAI